MDYLTGRLCIPDLSQCLTSTGEPKTPVGCTHLQLHQADKSVGVVCPDWLCYMDRSERCRSRCGDSSRAGYVGLWWDHSSTAEAPKSLLLPALISVPARLQLSQSTRYPDEIVQRQTACLSVYGTRALTCIIIVDNAPSLSKTAQVGLEPMSSQYLPLVDYINR
jgi:hypothetical protein